MQAYMILALRSCDMHRQAQAHVMQAGEQEQSPLQSTLKMTFGNEIRMISGQAATTCIAANNHNVPTNPTLKYNNASGRVT